MKKVMTDNRNRQMGEGAQRLPWAYSWGLGQGGTEHGPCLFAEPLRAFVCAPVHMNSTHMF